MLGAAALPRDRQARLLKYRGPVDDRELTSYHPEARRIMSAYVAGVNAFIAEATASGKLPVEFVLTGIRPEPWTIETLLSRQISFGDATSELQLARAWRKLGAEEANRRRNPDPFETRVRGSMSAIGDRRCGDRPMRCCAAEPRAGVHGAGGRQSRSWQQQLGRERRAVGHR